MDTISAASLGSRRGSRSNVSFSDGDHVSEDSSNRLCVTRRIWVPSALITKTSDLVSPVLLPGGYVNQRRKAILCPSGDQTGLSLHRLWVSARALLPSALAM